MAQRIDGKEIAAKVRAEVAARVAKLKADRGVTPGLTVVRVGADPASETYVRSKQKGALETGMDARELHLDAETSQEALLEVIRSLNADPSVHGILVQLPLPKHLDADPVIGAIDPRKDVDGFHPVNVGNLMLGRPAPRPCTPAGVMRMLREIGFDPKGKRAVVLGRSNIVGKPMAALLLHADATVTICHSRTSNLAEEVGRADLLVAAIGRARFVPGAWIRPGAVVVDVGMNRDADGKLCGDVDFEGASERASAITPVPGGVGLMTVALLLANTVDAAEQIAVGPRER